MPSRGRVRFACNPSEKISKAGSLKKNYGGVTPSKRRNHRALEQLRDEYLEEQEQKDA